ncbi:hypothetical protein HMPREF1981_02360 [Bacteroides pyogenes F0041]|uniref:Uncharacterized protein n=2 Tax=Bacteroides pyogenes TaxID=310300 RepID=U2CKC7_9BACE|nr:hypothetical protein HMPREF1981_02360 [Bacteroides pyogenes F0041]
MSIFPLEKHEISQERESMKKVYLLVLLTGFLSVPLLAQQHIVYVNLKNLLAQKGDTVTTLRIEKRSKSQILLTGGADYRITAGDNELLCHVLKKRCFAVLSDRGDLYLNCRKLRYKRLRFGGWFAPAVRLGNNIYFSAMPVGSVVGSLFVGEEDQKLGGQVGDALATSGLVNKRVCYELNGETGKVDFVGKERMLQLLEGYPEWRQAYLKENSQESKSTFKYIMMLKEAKE